MSTNFSSPLSSDFLSSLSKVSCFYDPSTCQHQCFSIPDKIVYHLAKNGTNATTFQKLVQTCKYFFKVNPVFVVPQVKYYEGKWYAYDQDNEKFWRKDTGFKYDHPINFKFWITHDFETFRGDSSEIIPSVYKNDAKTVYLQSAPLQFEEFLFFAGNAEKLLVVEQMVKYENGETVQLEDLVKHVPKLKILEYVSNDGSDVNSDTVRKLMEIEHFKNISHLELGSLSLALNIEEMYNFIIENKHIEVDLYYRIEISDAYEKLARKYSRRLGNEIGCKSRITFFDMDFKSFGGISTPYEYDSFFDDDSDVISDDDENEDLLFPWNNEDEEEWELPWDKTE